MVTVPDIVVSKFETTHYMVFLWMFQNGSHGLGITAGGLAFYRGTLTLIAYKEIELHPTIFMIVIELAAHFPEYVSHKVLLDGTMVAEQIASKDARLSAIFQHRNE